MNTSVTAFSSPPETDDDKASRMPTVLEAYARGLEQAEKLTGRQVQDSDFIPFLRRCASRLRLVDTKANEVNHQKGILMDMWKERSK